jgi:hypothetical protein
MLPGPTYRNTWDNVSVIANGPARPYKCNGSRWPLACSGVFHHQVRPGCQRHDRQHGTGQGDHPLEPQFHAWDPYQRPSALTQGNRLKGKSSCQRCLRVRPLMPANPSGLWEGLS